MVQIDPLSKSLGSKHCTQNFVSNLFCDTVYIYGVKKKISLDVRVFSRFIEVYLCLCTYSANPLQPPERVVFASLNHDLCKLGAQLTFISFVVHLVQEGGLSLSSHKIWRKCIFGEATFLPALSWLQMQNLSSEQELHCPYQVQTLTQLTQKTNYT